MKATTTTARASLSVAIIAKNEARHIRDCIESVAFADDIVVVDSGSNDDTVAIAQAAGARVVHQTWLGYGAQKRFAVNAAMHDWVLCLDADERVDAALAMEIQVALSSAQSFAYELPMQQRFMNRMLNHGDGYPLWKLRLFHRKYAQWSDDPIHESVKTNEKPSRLRGKLLHLPELTLHEWIAKQNQYTSLQAEHLLARRKTTSVWQLVASPLWRFIKYYVLQRGFLDGVPGFVHAVLNAAFVFSKYAKLWSLARKH
jgi:glycosyltransferase involved in cell wall biosynthesis